MQDPVIVAYAHGLKRFDNYARDFDMHTVDNLGLASKLYGNFEAYRVPWITWKLFGLDRLCSNPDSNIPRPDFPLERQYFSGLAKSC